MDFSYLIEVGNDEADLGRRLPLASLTAVGKSSARAGLFSAIPQRLRCA